MTLRIVGISGSLRRASFNSALLQAARSLTPPGVELAVHSIRDIPLYDGDVEDSEGIPPAVSVLKQAIVAAQGLLIVTPEYNNSLPGVLKNAVDWLSRPAADIPRVFGGRPVALMGASPGSFGTILSQSAWLPVLRTLRTEPWFGGRLLVSHAQNTFDAQGALQDETVRGHLREFLQGFADFLTAQAKPAP